MSNFSFLTHLGLSQAPAEAEDLLRLKKPKAALTTIRTFGEALCKELGRRHNLNVLIEFDVLIDELAAKAIINRRTSRDLHKIRQEGNASTHEMIGGEQVALENIRISWEIGVWFYQKYVDHHFLPQPFSPDLFGKQNERSSNRKDSEPHAAQTDRPSPQIDAILEGDKSQSKRPSLSNEAEFANDAGLRPDADEKQQSERSNLKERTSTTHYHYRPLARFMPAEANRAGPPDVGSQQRRTDETGVEAPSSTADPVATAPRVYQTRAVTAHHAAAENTAVRPDLGSSPPRKRDEKAEGFPKPQAAERAQFNASGPSEPAANLRERQRTDDRHAKATTPPNLSDREGKKNYPSWMLRILEKYGLPTHDDFLAGLSLIISLVIIILAAIVGSFFD